MGTDPSSLLPISARSLDRRMRNASHWLLLPMWPHTHIPTVPLTHVPTVKLFVAVTPATDQSEYGDERHPDAHAAARQRELINRTKNLESRIQRDIRQRDQANRNSQKGANSFHLADKDITVRLRRTRKVRCVPARRRRPAWSKLFTVSVDHPLTCSSGRVKAHTLAVLVPKRSK